MGTILSCIPGKLGYFEDEEVKSSRLRDVEPSTTRSVLPLTLIHERREDYRNPERILRQ